MGGKVIENESKLILDDDLIEPPPPLNDGGSPNVGGQVLKKGPWTAAEDRILEEYVKKHGEGNWNVVQRQSGLSRCGKSCRLRWSNHLRPNLKKGALSPEEEKKVAILHAMMGNKWSRIIAYLPGRTDNEIKNYWNTRRKKSQRFGTPLYPLGVSLPAKDDKKQSESVSIYDDYSVKQPNELLCGNGLDDSTITFDDFNGSHDAISYPPLFPDVSADHILTQGFGGENYGLACQVVDGVNQLIGSENMIPGYHSSVSSVLPSLEQFPVDPSPNMNQSFGLGYPYNPDPSFQTPAFAGGAGCGSHVLLPNDNFSYSGPLSGSVKLEFPSIQFSNSDGSQWLSKASTTFEASNGCINFPPNQYSDSNGSQWLSQVATPFQETGACIESPSMEVPFQPDLGLPINIAMLDSLVYVVLEESRSRNLSAEFPENISNHSVIVPNNTIENSGPDLRETDWWEGHKDPESPLGPSVASIFDESAPPSLADILPPGHNSENVLPIIEQVSRQNVVGKRPST